MFLSMKFLLMYFHTVNSVSCICRNHGLVWLPNVDSLKLFKDYFQITETKGDFFNITGETDLQRLQYL